MSVVGLLRKLLFRPRNREDLHFVMYTRAGCHLCDTAWHELERARQTHRFALEICDVDADPELRKQYGDCVPVVTVNGKVRFRGGVDRVLLERLLRWG